MIGNALKRITAKRHSLLLQLIILYMAISLVVSGISYMTIYSILLNNIQKRNEEATTEQFRGIENDIRIIEDNMEKSFLALASDEYVEQFLSSGMLDEIDYIITANEIYKSMANIMNNYQYIDSVFIFSQNGAALGYTSGKRTVKTGYAVQTHPFYSSALYELARKSNKNVWGGNIKKDFFVDLAEKGPKSDNQFLVCFIKQIAPAYNSSQVGVLVFNLDVELLMSRYRSYTGGLKIVDRSGTVISSSISAEIGTRYPYMSGDGSGELVDNQVFLQQQRQIQIIPYILEATGWTLVREIPLDTLQQDFKMLRNVVVLVFLANIIFVLIISTTSVNRMMVPLKQLAGKMNALENGNIGTQITELPNNEIGFLTSGFNRMSTSIGALIQKNRIVEEDKRKIEIEMLQYQMNPHFLFNTLNMIKWMALTVNASHVADAISTLGNMIGPVFRDKETMYRLSDEIDYVMNYIKILNLRYNKSVAISINIPEEVKECKILRFILQPLIENCFLHGLAKSDYQKKIEIRAEKMKEELVIAVEDDGIGMDEERLEQIRNSLYDTSVEIDAGTRRIGISNIQRRIRLHFGNAYGISIESSKNIGTTVRITVPFIL